MFKQFKFPLLAAMLFTAIGFFATSARSAEPQSLQSEEKQTVSGLSVTKTSSTSVALSWNGWTGSGDYTVSVLNLTSSQLEQQFTTPYTTAAVNNLTTGHTYRFSVDKAGYIITEDVVM